MILWKTIALDLKVSVIFGPVQYLSCLAYLLLSYDKFCNFEWHSAKPNNVVNTQLRSLALKKLDDLPAMFFDDQVRIARDIVISVWFWYVVFSVVIDQI